MIHFISRLCFNVVICVNIARDLNKAAWNRLVIAEHHKKHQ